MWKEKKSAEFVIKADAPATGGPGESPMPKMSAYDVLLALSGKLPDKKDIKLDITKLDINDTKIDVDGTAKTSQEIDSLVADLKKDDCFKDISLGETRASADGGQSFKLTITQKCM